MRINDNVTTFITRKINETDASQIAEILPSTQKLIESIEGFATAIDVIKFLKRQVQTGDLEAVNSVLYKDGETYLLDSLQYYGNHYSEDLKLLNSLGLDIVPKYVKTVSKDNSSFVIYEIPGTKSGHVLPFSSQKATISKEEKLKAYQDLQKLTQAGYVDNKIANSSAMWFVTPDTKRIVLPSIESLRPIENGEHKDILQKYYQILFE